MKGVIIILVNIIMGISWVIFAILAYTQIVDLPTQAALFPKMIIYGIGITGVAIIVATLIKKKIGETDNESSLTKDVLIFQILIPGALLLITYQLLGIFGFYISSFFLVIVVYFYQTYRANGTRLNIKHFFKGLSFAVIIITIMYVIFTLSLGLPVPSGSVFS